MEPAWVLGTPSGNETGSYLVVDFGGTKLRVCWVTLRTNKEKTDLKQKTYYLPQEIKTATAAELWDLVATSIRDFIADQDLVDEAGPNPWVSRYQPHVSAWLTVSPLPASLWGSPSRTLYLKSGLAMGGSSVGPRAGLSAASRERMLPCRSAKRWKRG